MSKKASPAQHVSVLLDGQSGWLGVFSSEDAANEAAATIGSHVGRKLSVFDVPFWYDKMGLEDLGKVLEILKPLD